MRQSKITPFEPLLYGLKNAFVAELSCIYDMTKACMITDNAWSQFQTDIPLIPEVSETSPWIKNIIAIAFEICIWRQLESEGMSLDDISALTCKVLAMTMGTLPPEAMNNMQNMILSESYIEMKANDSAALDACCNWKFKVIYPVGSDTFDIGMDIHSCPVITLCNNLGVARYARYFCQNDYATYAAFGIKLTRTRTLAEGGESCDFRLTKMDKIPSEI